MTVFQCRHVLSRARRAPLYLFSFLITVPAFSGGGSSAFDAAEVSPVAISGDTKLIAATNPLNQGLSLIDTGSGDAKLVSPRANSAYGASISPDGKYLGYKTFEGNVDGATQVPTLYEIATGKTIPLISGPLAGTPAFAANEQIAYTVANKLYVLSAGLVCAGTYELGNHANLIALSPDASKVAYNNDAEQIVVLNLRSGQRHVVTDGKNAYYRPQFSPNGKKLLVSTVTGDAVVVGLNGGRVHRLGAALSPGWIDDSTVAGTRKFAPSGIVTETELVSIGLDGRVKDRLASQPGDADAVVANGRLAIGRLSGAFSATRSSDAGLSFGYVSRGQTRLASIGTRLAPPPADASEATIDGPVGRDLVNGSTTMQLSNVPYIHQNNDTPDYWNGNSSCNATAALMAIQYYNILPKHPITCTWPSSHTSDYGWYIPEIYTYNAHTYNIGSADPNGRIGYGGFGYITQNGWEDTKTHMAEYISYHGPTSSVDWSPTMAKAQTEVAANHPFVILTSLTSAGHYPLCIGYVKGQNTLIFNDPYGNKNSGSYPSPDGRNARYDWPGYNNGYQNLNTVWCYIWARFGQPSAPTNLTATAASSSQINLTWTDNSSCEANYVVARSTTSGGPYTDIATLGANVTSYSNTGLAASTTYYYVVRAKNPSGSSANSGQASATTSGAIADQILDNSGGAFTASANWSTGTSAADKYGADYRFRATAAISDAAQWSFNISSARNYEMYAWWSQGTNRSSTAPYILPDGTSVPKNQQASGGMWNSLGIKALATGTNTVKLSCWTTTGFVVVADAIKVVAR